MFAVIMTALVPAFAFHAQLSPVASRYRHHNIALSARQLDLGTAYKIIGISPGSSPSALRQAFKQRARCLHPDVNVAADADLQFRELVAAYELLSGSEPELQRPWMYQMAESKAVRIFMAVGFIGGQCLSWYLYFYAMSHPHI